jgi:hypothetical protein
MRKEERMGRGWVAGFSTFLLLVGFCGGSTPGYAGMDVSVNIGIPAVVVAQPPEMVLVPDSQIYYAPSVEAELFFYRGNWYTRHGRRWYREGLQWAVGRRRPADRPRRVRPLAGELPDGPRPGRTRPVRAAQQALETSRGGTALGAERRTPLEGAQARARSSR